MKKAKRQAFAKRNFHAPGPMGTVLCEITLPALELRLDRRITLAKPARMMAAVRRFVGNRLTGHSAALQGAGMTVTAFVRKDNGRFAPKRLVTWKYGESLDEALAAASDKWVALFEEAG